MSELFFDPNLVANLNLLAQLQLPLLRFMIDEWLKSLQGKANRYQRKIIERILTNEHHTIDYQRAISSLQFFFKVNRKHQFTPKQLRTLLNENTLLAENSVDYLADKYWEYIQETAQAEKSLKWQLRQLHDVKWSLINIRSDNNGQNLNKMFVKVQFCSCESKTVTMSLFEFRIFLNEMANIQTMSK